MPYFLFLMGGERRLTAHSNPFKTHERCLWLEALYGWKDFMVLTNYTDSFADVCMIAETPKVQIGSLLYRCLMAHICIFCVLLNQSSLESQKGHPRCLCDRLIV